MITRRISLTPDAIAPDGSEVRILAASSRGSMAHFTLQPGQVSQAVAHRSVEEIWYLVSGHGRMWRKFESAEEIVDLNAGVSLTIPIGTHFQFRCDGDHALAAVGVTMPPWRGMDEAYSVKGLW